MKMKYKDKWHYMLLLLGLVVMSVSATGQTREEKMVQVLAHIQAPEIPINRVDITRFGAKGDGRTNAKPAFDKAMKMATKKGGLHVVVPAGDSLKDGPWPLVRHLCVGLPLRRLLTAGSHSDASLPCVLLL